MKANKQAAREARERHLSRALRVARFELTMAREDHAEAGKRLELAARWAAMAELDYVRRTGKIQ
jgi:hypothetical protein